MRKLHSLLILPLAALLCCLSLCAQAEVIFNEVMASTAIFVSGRHDDWVELHNTEGAQVPLKGWYLSNDPYHLQRWAFPDDAKIAKNGYLVVYCAGEEVTDGQKGALYADFKISAQGDELYLTDPNGTTQTLTFGSQFGNVSSGRTAAGEWLYMEKATPGEANVESGYAARAEEPLIETAAGFYTDAVDVVISAPAGQEIRYTLDSSEPTRESALYTEPLHLSKTTVVRARAFAGDLLGSTTAGSTYFINDPAPVSVVSIYTDNDYLFSNKKGILVKGSGNTPNYEKNWEYPIQIEYFDESGTRQLSQMGTVRVAGHSSRSGRQKSLSLFARSAYGADTFACDFFEDRDYAGYSAIQLRCTNSDYRSCRMRDAVLTQVSEGLGLYYQAARPILVYINGEYYGHYNLREKANKDSLAQWEGITDSAAIKGIDILEGTGLNKTQVIKGSNADWVELMDFCKSKSLKDAENLQYVLDRLDVDSMFSYVIFNMMIGNYDAGNVRVYRFPGGKWKFMLHDVEAGCMNANEAPVDAFLRSKSAKSSAFPHWALAALLEVPEYRDMFLRRTAEIVQSNFMYSTWVGPIYEKWLATLSELMPRHIAKFRHFTFKEWNTNVHASMYYARVRPKKVIGFICTRLKVTKSEKEDYFGETLDQLAVFNAREQ